MNLRRTDNTLFRSAGFTGGFAARSLGLLSLLVLASSATAQAASWDLSNDFSFAANPNGQWTYGDFSGLPSAGGNFTTYTGQNTSLNLVADVGGGTLGPLDIWSPGGTDPNVNYNPYSVQANLINAIYWDPHQVNFSSSGVPASGVEWTAPVTGLYEITAKFWNAQSSAAQNEYIDQASTVLGVTTGVELFHGITTNSVGPNGSASAISYTSPTAILIVAGTQIDFLTTSGQNIGVSATITAVPEPASLVLLGLAGLGLLCAAGRRRRG